jgi:stearoyl-CoA desaturase (delta-9 desaturase)
MTLLYGYLFYYFSALIGISIGYHRYFTHRSFDTSVVAEYIMLFFGLICGGRSALTWAAVHRMHHSKSDTEKDPHSPVYVGKLKVLLSRWKVEYIPRKHIADLLRNPRIVFFHRYGKYIHFTYAAVVLLFGLNAFLIFVMAPYVIAWAGFGLLNYVAHRNGMPNDVPIMNLIAPGEGWHKYHHDHPRAHKLNKYDIAGWTIERFFAKPKSSC